MNGRNAVRGGALVLAAALVGCSGGDGPGFAPIARTTDVIVSEANDLRGLAAGGARVLRGRCR